MTAQIIKLHQPKKATTEMTLEVIDRLREMIVNGEIEQFMGVFIDSGGMFGTVHCRDAADFRMIGAIEVAKLEMMDVCLQCVSSDDH